MLPSAFFAAFFEKKFFRALLSLFASMAMWSDVISFRRRLFMDLCFFQKEVKVKTETKAFSRYFVSAFFILFFYLFSFLTFLCFYSFLFLVLFLFFSFFSYPFRFFSFQSLFLVLFYFFKVFFSLLEKLWSFLFFFRGVDVF